jgi:hypothetical protein
MVSISYKETTTTNPNQPPLFSLDLFLFLSSRIHPMSSNIFKTNSRFAALMDDNDNAILLPNQSNTKQTFRVEDNNQHSDRRNTFKTGGSGSASECHYGRSSFRSDHQRKEEDVLVRDFETQIKERKIMESLKIDKFPSLNNKQPTPEKTQTQTQTYVSLLKKAKSDLLKTDGNDDELSTLKPGWVLLARDPVTRQTIIKGIPKEKQQANPANDSKILEVLASLYEKRTRSYIEQYGYDTWEKMFRFPNYDYDYFNKLDEQFDERETQYQHCDDLFFDNYNEE